MANNIRHQAQQNTMIKIKRVEMKLENEFNNMPGQEKIEELLIHYLGQNGTSKYEVVDAPEMKYWANDVDTLVIQIDGNDTWRFGEEAVMRFAISLTNFVQDIHCDEFQTQKNGSKTIMRFWWD